VDVDAARAAEGDSGTGQAGDKAVALRGGDAETRCCGAVDDDGEQGRAQAGERHGAVSAKVNDMRDGIGDARVKVRHDEHAEEVECGAHENGGAGGHATRSDAGRDGVGRVGPSVDEDGAQREDHGDGKDWVRHNLAEEG